MSFCNNYTPPPPINQDDLYGSDPYDINFSLPLNLSVLENERVKLTPLIPRIHAREYLEQVQKHPEIHQYLPFPFPKTLEDVCIFFRDFGQRIPGHITFAIHDKTRPSDKFDRALSGGGSFAGIIALIHTSIPNLSTELGLPTNASGLLINYCLNLPSDPVSPGLGFRRFQWAANSENQRSIAAAERLGFRLEGTTRWHGIQPVGKEGLRPREGDPAGDEALGRHSVVLSLCWDDWVGGAKGKLALQMSRK